MTNGAKVKTRKARKIKRIYKITLIHKTVIIITKSQIKNKTKVTAIPKI